MNLHECFEYMAERRGDALVVTSAGSSSAFWWDVTRDDGHAFYLNASMSLSLMFASGIAAGLPERTVWAFTGDGAFVMNTGMLFVEQRMLLPNVKHFIIDNGCYASTDRVDISFGRSADYAAMARAAGLERVYRFSDLADFEAGFDEAVLAPGHSFIVLEIDDPGPALRTPSIDGPEVKFRFGRHVEKTAGIKIFTA